MNNSVRFSIGCLGVLIVAFVVVMYFAFGRTSTVGPNEDSAKVRIEQWMRQTFPEGGRELAKLGRVCSFEGEKARYRIVEVREISAPASTPAERFLLLVKPDETVASHWTLPAFIETKKKEAQAESTPERKAWREKRLEALLKELGASAEKATGTINVSPAPSTGAER
jgi:hypothetical protein